MRSFKKKSQQILSFTQREYQCLSQAVKHATLSQIAASLSMTENSVSFYLNSIIRKLELLNLHRDRFSEELENEEALIKGE